MHDLCRILLHNYIPDQVFESEYQLPQFISLSSYQISYYESSFFYLLIYTAPQISYSTDFVLFPAYNF